MSRRLPLLAIVLLLGVGARSAAAVECSALMTAWQDEKPTRARRAALEETARERAVDDLARRAFSVAVREDYLQEVRRVRSGAGAATGGYSEDLVIVDVARSYYEIDAELRGGTYEASRGKKSLSVRYCVDDRKFQASRENVRRRRDELVATVRQRFGDVEQALARRDYGLVGRSLLPDLKNDVSRAVLDVELYRSPGKGVSRRFSDWLREWSEIAGHEREFAVYSCERARDAIRRSRLAEADLFVADGLKVDAHDVACLQVRDRVRDLRDERRRHLEEAREAANAGRFSAADDLVARARAIDVDDLAALEESERGVQEARTEFRKSNPPVRLGVVLGYGGIGVDTDATAVAVVPGATPSGPGAAALFDLQIRLGRVGFLFGEYGAGGGSYEGYWGSAVDLYSSSHWAGGLGLKTVRKGKSLARWEFSGGVLSQEVKVGALAGEPKARKTGAVARVGLDAGRLYLFVQRTFLFEDETTPDGPVRWSDQFLGGIGLWLF